MSLVEQDLDAEGILTLCLNREEKLNVLSTELLSELSNQLTEAKTKPEVKALIITGKGKAFCAGADINRLAECTAKSGYEFACFGQSVFRQLETLGKPSIAAVNGFAFGGGCELAISASMRIASTQAMFGQPEVKLGVIPGYGGTQRLTRLIGKGRALDLCLTGRFIKADLALNWGLVTEVVTPELLLIEAKKIMQGVLSMGPLAVAAVMSVMDYDSLSLEEGLRLEAATFGVICASQDKKEGVSAFLEKRSPQFKGI